MTDVLIKQVKGGIKAPLTAIKELNKGISDEEAEEEYIQILAAQGAPVVDEGDREKETSDLSFDYDEAAEEQIPTENSAP